MEGCLIRKRINDDGALSLIDATLFFVIMIMATSVLYSYGSASMHDASSFDQDLHYAESFSDALLQVHIDACYFDKNGNNVSMDKTRISSALMDEYVLVSSGVPRSNLSYIDSSINKNARFLLPSAHHYALDVNNSVFVSDSANGIDDLPEQHSAVQRFYPHPHDGTTITITIFVWEE